MEKLLVTIMDHKLGFVRRWFFSTNHKDIGTLYIIFALIAGLIGGFFSLLMRAELAAPGLDIVADGQAWNVIITAHGLINGILCCYASFNRWIWKLVYSSNDWCSRYGFSSYE